MTFRECLAVVLFGSFCLFADVAHPASSQNIVPHVDNYKPVDSQFCKDRMFDVEKIVRGRASGINKDKLHDLVNKSVNELGEERASDINVMIEEAYHQKDEDALLDWAYGKLKDCGI